MLYAFALNNGFAFSADLQNVNYLDHDAVITELLRKISDGEPNWSLHNDEFPARRYRAVVSDKWKNEPGVGKISALEEVEFEPAI